ncbi:MAG: DUF1622 domain-containing protein [Epsilonproteobacteria bacterium]|nr:DUF1622 domain-containing protein [Campylobacterota bacterium]
MLDIFSAREATMESVPLFDLGLPYIKIFIELIGIAIITLAAFHAAYTLLKELLTEKIDLNYVRYQFGCSVILGLEFMVGADIIGSLVNPSYYNMGILAIVVVIRTILSYFISLELERLPPEQKRSLSQKD